MDTLINKLTEIDGIGVAKAKELIELGVKKPTDLRLKKFNELLSIESKLSVKYRICKEISWDFINSLLHVFSCAGMDYLVGVGSYRRKVAFSSDIDLLTTNNLDNVIVDLNKLTEMTKQDKDALKVCKSSFELIGIYSHGSMKISMVALFREKYVRIDIFKTTKAELPFALLHYTGSKLFNIRIRAKAKNMGLKLNQHGLYADNKKIKEEFTTEQSVLKYIGVTYKIPENRNEV